MSGLVSGLQNRVRRFESARYLRKSFSNGTLFLFLCIIPHKTTLLYNRAIITAAKFLLMSKISYLRGVKHKQLCILITEHSLRMGSIE